MKKCKICDTLNPDEASFCTKCGNPFNLYSVRNAYSYDDTHDNSEDIFWNVNKSTITGCRIYLSIYPEGRYASEALLRIKQIKRRIWIMAISILMLLSIGIFIGYRYIGMRYGDNEEVSFFEDGGDQNNLREDARITYNISNLNTDFNVQQLPQKSSQDHRQIQNEEDVSYKTEKLDIQANNVEYNYSKVEVMKTPPIPTDFILVPGGVLSYDGNYCEGYKKHRVEVDSFYICKFELTQREYKRVIGSLNKENYMWLIVNSWYLDKGPEYSEVKGDSIPVRGNLKQFAEYCNARSRQEGYDGFYEIENNVVKTKVEGNGYRLITPYEWIFAAYGGNLNRKDKYLGGKNLSEVAWHYGNSKNKPHPVGLKKPNVIGLYDIQGNAPEILQGDMKHKCYISMCGQYNVSNWNYSQAYDPTYICYLKKDESDWTYGTRIALVPKNLKNDNLKIQYDYYE